MTRKEPYSVTGDAAGLSAGSELESRLKRIAAKARSHPQEKFSSLTHHLNYEMVKDQIDKMPPKSAAGLDGMSVPQARKNADWLLPPLLDAIHKGEYDAPAVRRVYIPKANGGERPLGVPEVIDRAIQAGAAKVLGSIYEQDFLSCSFGFRPGLSCHHALATINVLLTKQKLNFALEVDIRDFFGSLSHEWLRRFLEHRIGDQRILKLIEAWLKAGVMENGKWQEGKVGTPQGGSISPLLANVYLHYVLDLWFEKKIKRRLKGKSHLVRYCDDFVIFFEREEDLEEMQVLLKARLAQFDLMIAEEKTHSTDLRPRPNRGGHERRHITFLGFTIYLARNRLGTGWKIVFETEAKRLSRVKAAMKAKLRDIMHWDLKHQASAINQLLTGHYVYYGMAGNGRRLAAFWHQTIVHWRRCLSQRSQNGLVNWEQMNLILAKHPLRAGNPHVRFCGGTARRKAAVYPIGGATTRIQG